MEIIVDFTLGITLHEFRIDGEHRSLEKFYHRLQAINYLRENENGARRGWKCCVDMIVQF